MTAHTVDREAIADMLFANGWVTYHRRTDSHWFDWDESHSLADAIIALLSAEPAASQGYVLVPREPTEAMIEAGATAIEELCTRMVAREASENPEDMPDYDAGHDAAAAWYAMLSANPLSPSKQSDGHDG